MISRSLLKMPEDIDVNYDLIAIELDTYQNRMRYISSASIDDIELKELFDKFYHNLRSKNPVVNSIVNNGDIYEVGDDCILVFLYEDLSARYIIFDVQDANKVENLIFKSN